MHSCTARPSASTEPVMPPESRCPRCGGAFHCGANDAAPCACTTLTLTPALRAELGARFHGCLCLACLRELAAEAARVSCAPCTPDSSA